MIMTAKSLCTTFTNPKVAPRGTPRMVTVTNVYHEGPCTIGLHLKFAGVRNDQWDSAWAVRRAFELADSSAYDDQEVLAAIETVRELLDRPTVEKYFITVTPEEKRALSLVLEEARDYWVVCNYADDEGDDEDQLLGRLAEGGLLMSIATCWNQQTTTETTERKA